MFKIVADSSCDIFTKEGIDFETVPMILYTDEKEYLDDENLDVGKMTNELASYKGRSYTACPSPEGWIKAFKDAEEIYVVTITSNLSGACQSANLAKDMYISEHPDAKIYVCDSLSTGPEMALIIEKIAELKKNGASFEEVCERIEEYTSTTRLFFTLKSLHNLAQNGRINKAVASAIGMLHICIVGTASEQGDIAPINKVRGEKKAIINTLTEMKKAGYNGGKAYISHVENEPLANSLADLIRTEFPQAQIKVYPTRGLCSFYAERGGFLIGCEC
ncbi:MAG: DegV family protein [Lachnospiraceae bacterium]|nr:DegV family protein [Lachnospiraceae bacterium]